MKNIFDNIIILFLLISFSKQVDSVNLQITRSKSFFEQTGNLTPLLISVSTEDKDEKIKGVDLICIVDVSSSMSGTRINLVKESLEYLVNLMNDDDSFALVTFSSNAKVINDFTKMNSTNKIKIINNIKSLKVSGATNILAGLESGLDLIKSDYSTGDKVCSMILLSDGDDNYNYNNVVSNFKNYISNQKKNNYFFTLHSFGYGDDHNSELLNKIALIREGGYFYIRKLFMVKDFLLEIYGSLSTVYKVNVTLNVHSNFQIQTVYGIEDMYQASLTGNGINFNTLIIHLVYGKNYQFVILVNVPQNTQVGTEILKATLSPLNKNASYFWDQAYSPYAYEEYIRCISMTYFLNSYNAGKDKGITIINQGINWIKSNYDGNKNWLKEFYDILEDLKNFNSFGKANMLSKIHELKVSKLGIYDDDENSYQKKIIDDSYRINVNQFFSNKFSGTIFIKQNHNYFYFYLKYGKATINNLYFSENCSSIILYTDKIESINITCLTEECEYNYKFENKTRIQTIIDFSRGGKFIYKKDFPFDFYVKIDGKKDMTFNIQFIKFEFDETSDIPDHNFEIKAFIVDEQQIEIFKNKNNYLPNSLICKGYYDKGFRIGKIVLKKEEISKYLNFNSQNYLYIIVQKPEDSNIIYNYVQGQFSFVSMDYINNIVPENFYIFSNLSIGQKTPHLYTLQMEPNLGSILRVEFAISSEELDCKILKFQNYLPGSEEYYLDNPQFHIVRKNHMGKTYIDIAQSNNKETKFDKIILSIFSKNGGHIAGSEIRKLSYTIRYSTYSGYGIYSFNDIYNKDGEIEIVQNENDQRNFTINFYPLKSASDDLYNQEKTRFFIKVYPIIKIKQKVYQTISLFEDSTPEIFLEKNINNEKEANFQIQIDPNKNYIFDIYTISNNNHEILSYKSKKTYIIPSNIEIDDDNSFEYELLGDKTLEFNISDKDKKYLIIHTSDFENGNYGLLYVRVGDNLYKSVQPSDNIIIISTEKCIGKKIKVEIKIKEGKIIPYSPYILTIKMLNQIEIDAGENIFFEMLEEYKETMEILIKNNDGNKVNIFVQSSTGEFTLNGIDSKKSEFFGAKSSNFIEAKSFFFEIKAKTGEFISLYTRIINNSKKRVISNYDISLYGYLEEKDCIYIDENILNIKKYQVRIIADKIISINYNGDATYEYTEPGVLYLKEFSEKIDKICLKQKYDTDSIFFGLQIVDTSDQTTANIILQPSIFSALYKDKLYKDEIRYYRQGLFDYNKNSDLRYKYSVKQIKGEIKVFISQCDKYPNCEITKKDLENNNKIISLYNINEVFSISKKAKDFISYSPENILMYIILCLSDSCEYSFIINKSTSFIDLARLQKYSSKIYKNSIDKFIVSPKNDNYQIISIITYSHSGEIMLSVNDNCEDIKHMVFGHIEKMEIPKSCNINNSLEIYVQANTDSIYSIEYSEISDIKYTKIKSNIIHFENIDKEKIIEYTPVKGSYSIKFIPINCEISIKYGNKNVPSQYKIYYYNSDFESEKYYNFTIFTDSSDCMVYTYLEELTENLYGILTDQVPYYLSLNKNNKNYKLIYPLPNGNYNPLYRINFFKETHIKINQKILNEKDEEINAVAFKDIKPSSKILEKCKDNDICYLIIEIEYEADVESPVILEIIPKSSNEIPGILLDNKMKQDFIPLDGPEQQYMVKIQKDEEGEIYFNYKYFSGEIIGKLININKKSWKNRHDLPKPNEYLIYDNLRQKISFSKKETNKCDNGCYLFVEVNCLEKLKDKRYYQGLNMDYSIYLKKTNNLVHLRLNEIIIGTLSKTIEDNYIEYYSIEMPYSTSKIYIDYLSENTNIIINSGNIKPTYDKSEYSFIPTRKAQIFIIDINDSKRTFIIGIYTKKLNNGISQYSFRIRAENKLLKNYIYSDSITENFCVTNNNNESCYFLIPVVNIQKNANLFLYSFSSSISDNLIISYKKVRLYEKIGDESKFDYQYEKTSKDQFIKNILFINNSELNINENDNILIKIDVPEKGTITLLHTFKVNLYESLLNPINNILYTMNPNEELYLNIPNGVKSLVHINSIKGKGKIGYEFDDNSAQTISGKYSALYLQSLENNYNRRIKIRTDSENPFYFYIYIKVGSIRRNINNINLGSAFLRTGEGFPIEFYSKISENESYTINFKINNIKEIEDQNSEVTIFKIKAYIVTEEIIDRLKLDETFVFSAIKPLIGKYEIGFGILKIALSSEVIKKYYDKFKNNYIYLKIEELNTNPSILKNVQGEIIFLQNNKINFVSPENTYINSNLEPGKNSTHKYKLIKKDINDKMIRIEFSSSSDNVKYRIYNDKNNKLNSDSSAIVYEEKENLGKKNIDIKLDDAHESFIFEVYSDKIVGNKNKLSYTLRYRTDDGGKKVFNNYNFINKTNGELLIKIQNNKTTLITIPSIQNSQTLQKVNSKYYLKIYKYDKDDIMINNTISIIDGIEPYKTYEFKFDGEYYNKSIEIPSENSYYLTVTAITTDKELLAYKSVILIDNDNQNNDNQNNDNNKNKNYWTIIIIIIAIGVIFILIISIIIIHCICKKKKSLNAEDLRKTSFIQIIDN